MGVFEYTPPSQYASPSMRTAANAGGSAADAITWSMRSGASRLSKYFSSPLRTETAPIVNRVFACARTFKSTSDSSVRFNGSVE